MSARRFAPLVSVASVAASAIAACYGSGPEPTAPSSAKIVWRAPAGAGSCSATYVGPMAVTSTTGYAVALPYALTGCFTVMRDTSISTFPLDGTSIAGDPLPQGGQSGTVTGDSTHIFASEPQLAVSGSAVAFVYQGTSGTTLGPAQTTITGLDGSDAGFLTAPTGIAFDGTSLYATIPKTSSFQDPVDPFNPLYPRTGQQLVKDMPSALWRTDWPPPSADATLHWIADTTLSCGELEHCLVANPTNLFYIGLSPGPESVAAIYTVAETGSIPTLVGTVPSSMVDATAVPVGLVADATRIVLVMANAPSTNDFGAITPGCWVFEQDLAATPGPMGLTFKSSDLSCMGAALDTTHVYFAVVHSGDIPCAGCTAPLHGDGVGRVSLDATKTFESIAFEIAGATAGPRRVYLASPETMIVADPSTVAAVPTDVFAQRRDLGP